MREAVIAFQFRSDVSESGLDGIREQLKRIYPESKTRQILRPSFLGPSAVANRILPYHVSDDRRRTVQVHAAGFSFSLQSPPYPGWQEVANEARKLWDVCRSQLALREFRSIEVRFVNALEVSDGISNLQYYFRTPSSSPGEIPGVLESFYNRWIVALENPRCHATIVQALRPIRVSSGKRVLLDIAVQERPAELLDEQILWKQLDALRDKAHEIFRGILTEAAYSSFS
jgi:uncharacterized protein (TIGR04255 family)